MRIITKGEIWKKGGMKHLEELQWEALRDRQQQHVVNHPHTYFFALFCCTYPHSTATITDTPVTHSPHNKHTRNKLTR